jgi:hypothetical protein
MRSEEMAQSIMEMYDSLITSINLAGGAAYGFTPYHLKIMTVPELIGKLATNNIRFTYIKKTPKKEEPIDPEEEFQNE